ncbi:MAG: ribosome recycling factor [Alphaproteobacteria bacterium]|nr:MAG: ribosome recycling factor [Alphaproteobacteria bacterium]
MSAAFSLKDLERRMKGALDVLKTEFAGLRTGRASASLLDPVTVEVYGTTMPLNQVATVSVPDPRMLTVQVWDRANAGAVDKAIRNAGLGLNPVSEGAVIRVPIPELNEERRRELSKVAGKYAEAARVSVRNVRRDGMDTLKRLEKDHEMSQDEHKKQAEAVQAATDRYIAEIDKALAAKEAEIMQV